MYKKQENGSFLVDGTKGNKWAVSANIKSCDCPKFKFILHGQGACHHMEEVLDGEAKKMENPTGFPKFNRDDYKEMMAEIDFAAKYGDEQLDWLKETGEVFILKGKVRLI